MKEKNMDGADGVFIVLEVTGRPYPRLPAMLVKYDGHQVLDSAKLMMSTEEALSFADYCRFKSYFRSIEGDLERRWVRGYRRSGLRGATNLVARERLQRRSRSSAAHA